MPEYVRTRAMTSKQAKAAYRKAGGPRYTEKELRQQKRSAELWEREQRCKEKEKMKKENKLKRLKKEEKELEQRRKIGLPEKNEGYVSPRQRRLVSFFGKGKDEDGESERAGRDDGHRSLRGDNSAIDNHAGRELMHQASPAEPSALQEVTANRNSQTPRATDKPHGLTSPTALLEEAENWMALFPSNTQVGRELSPSASPFKTPAKQLPPPSSPRRPPSARRTMVDVQDTMSFLSTQDLVFTAEEIEDLTTPANAKEVATPVTAKDSFDFGEFRVSTQELLELDE